MLRTVLNFFDFLKISGHFRTYTVNSFENFDINSIFGLGRNSKNAYAHTKMVTLTKVIDLSVTKCVYWFVNPIGT